MEQDLQPKSIFNEQHGNGTEDLPNATAVLVVGILSLFINCLGITGIIAIVMANKQIELYNEYPGTYSKSSLNNVKAGKICGIISLCIVGLVLLFVIFGGGMALFFGR